MGRRTNKGLVWLLGLGVTIAAVGCRGPQASGSRELTPGTGKGRLVAAADRAQDARISQASTTTDVVAADPTPRPSAPTGAEWRLESLPLHASPEKRPLLGDPGVDWASVAEMNRGTPSPVDLGAGWAMAVSSGQDRLEECEPTMALTEQRPGFTDTFLYLSASYRLSRSAYLIGSVAGVRIQDQALSEAVDEAELSSVTVGVSFRF